MNERFGSVRAASRQEWRELYLIVHHCRRRSGCQTPPVVLSVEVARLAEDRAAKASSVPAEATLRDAVLGIAVLVVDRAAALGGAVVREGAARHIQPRTVINCAAITRPIARERAGRHRDCALIAILVVNRCTFFDCDVIGKRRPSHAECPTNINCRTEAGSVRVERPAAYRHHPPPLEQRCALFVSGIGSENNVCQADRAVVGIGAAAVARSVRLERRIAHRERAAVQVNRACVLLRGVRGQRAIRDSERPTAVDAPREAC